MTGRHEFKNGVTHTILERERLTLKATTLAQVLKSAGYTTGIFGKWHLGDEPDHWPDKRGFDEMFIHGGGGIGQTYPGSCGDAPGNTYFDPAILHNGKFEKTTGYCTDVFFAQATNWIESVKGKQPFFCYIATNAPHAPLQVRPEDEKRYADKVKTAERRQVLRHDRQHRRQRRPALAKLKEWDLERDTLVIFMNDNGGTVGVQVFNAGMRGQEGHALAGRHAGGLVLALAGHAEAGDVKALAAHIDFFPTIAEIAGDRPDRRGESTGRGPKPGAAAAKPEADWPDRILFTHVGRWPKGANPEHKYAIAACAPRAGIWLRGQQRRHRKRGSWFDVKADPGEKTNVAAQHPDVVADLDRAFDVWWKSVQPQLVNENAVGPVTNPFKDLYEKQFGK